MKYTLRISITVLIFIVATFFSSQIVAASDARINSNYLDSAVSEFINIISSDLPEFYNWKDAIVFRKNVLNAPEGLSGDWIIYEMNYLESACGYLIVNQKSGKIVEFSSGISPFRQYLDEYLYEKYEEIDIEINELVYYPGYYAVNIVEHDTGISHYVKFTEDKTVKLDLTNRSKIVDNEKVGIFSTDSEVQYKLINGVPDSTYYLSCIPTAIGNLIGYWDTHGYPNLIVSPYNIYFVISDVSERMISTSGNNMNNAAIPDAIRYYCNSRYPNNFTNITNLWNPSFISYRTQINYNRPTLLGFAAGSYYGSHMTCGTGYYWNLAYGDPYSIVHDAWSSTSVDCYQLWGSWNDFICKVIP